MMIKPKPTEVDETLKVYGLARNSGMQGTKPREDAAAETYRVADDILRHTGRDIRPLLPSEEEIVKRLGSEECKRVPSFDFTTGKRFVNEFLVLDLSPSVRFLVSTGSGKKIDGDLGQPWLTFLNADLKSYKPDWLAWHRVDRVFRTRYLGATTLHICDVLDITVIDGKSGVYDGDFSFLLALLKAREASDEAELISIKGREGQGEKTDNVMVDGVARYQSFMPPPAGMMTVRLKAPNGLPGIGELRCDTPACYPDATLVAYGLPEVFISGRRPDQVKLVRFALRKLGRPGWSKARVARKLSERGFSTARLRLDNTPETWFSAEHINSEWDRVMRPIVDRLELYRTGELLIDYGTEGVANQLITNVFPPDGPWAKPEDFERIEAYLGTTRGGGPAKLGLSGVMVETDVGALPLRAAPKGRRRHGPSYVLRPAEAGVRGCLSLPALPHSAIAESIVEALIAYADQLLAPLVELEIPRDEELCRELQTAKDLAEQITGRCDAILDSLSEFNGAGELRVQGHARDGLSERYNRMLDERLKPAEAEVARLVAEMSASAGAATEEDTAIAASLLLRLVESLRDPFNTTHNSLWKSAIRIDSITRQSVIVHQTAGTMTRWRGTIRIEGAGHEFAAPFEGEYLEGAAAGLKGKADVALEQLLNGTPFRNIVQTNATGVRLKLADEYGFDSRYFGLVGCDDPRLVKIAAHLMVAKHHNPEHVSEALDEPMHIVEEVLHHLTSGRPTWGAVDLGRSAA